MVSFRDGPLQDLKVPLAWTAAVAAVLAGLLAVALLIADHHASGREPQRATVRTGFDQAVEPAAAVLAAPLRWAGSARDYLFDYFNAAEENHRLKAKLVEMSHFRDEAFALRNINKRYEALLNLRTEPPTPMVSARAVSDVRGPFSHARLLDAGSERGVKVGNPVIAEYGAVGRIVGVARGVSRVLLLTDVDSRTPVLISTTNSRAILAGDGGDSPRLLYLRGASPVKRGDVVLTSGDGGMYPRGLPVGVAVQDMKGQWRVQLYSDQSAIDYVRILEFDDFSQVTDQAALNDRAMPPVSAAEKAQIQATLAARTAAPRPDASKPDDAKPDAAKSDAGRSDAAPAQPEKASKHGKTKPGRGDKTGADKPAEKVNPLKALLQKLAPRSAPAPAPAPASAAVKPAIAAKPAAPQ